MEQTAILRNVRRPADLSTRSQLLKTITRRRWLGMGAVGALGTALPRRLAAAESGDGDRGITVWDGHCHLAALSGATPEARMRRLIEVADRMQIDRLVVFMGWPFSYDPSPAEFRRQNDQVLSAIREHRQRALAYAYVNPNHVRESLDEMHRCIADGPMVGVKLWVARRCRDAALDPIIRLASELRAVVYQHTWLKVDGNLPGESTPSDLAELARRHPQTMLICGHTGGDWERGIRAVRPLKNVYVETGGGDPAAGLVEMAVRELGADRVIYGSDAAGRSFASQLAKVVGADIPQQAKRQILAGNLRRLLTPILKAKGHEF